MTFAVLKAFVKSGRKENLSEVTLKVDITSYTTGGEALTSTLATYLPNSVEACTAVVSNESGKNQTIVWDHANKKLMAYNAADGNQVTAATDIGEHVVTWIGY